MTEVQYKPARIQTLSSEQEIAFKQFWGYLLKYFGYDLSISSQDLAFKEAFVASSTSATKTSHWNGQNAVNASNTKKGFFGGSKAVETRETQQTSKDAKKSKRVLKVQSKKSEKYVPIQVSDQHKYTYYTHYSVPQEFSRCYDNDDDNSSSESSVDTLATSLSVADINDAKPAVVSDGSDGKKLETKARTSVLPIFKSFSPKDIHSQLWKVQRNDLLDNMMLRFVRARNFDLERALQMFTTDLNWRATEYDSYSMLLEGDAPSYLEGKNPGLIKNLEAKKAWIRGTDKKGNTIFMFRAALHFGGDAPQDEMRRWCILLIEWTRLFLRDITDSRDQVSLIFDLTGFSLKNADYTTIKFIADVFEAHYPECLANIFIFNAPWVFSTFWNIIKGWLDPVVSSKIRFVKNLKEISEYVDISCLPKFMGGEDEYTGEYVPPRPEDASTKPKDATYQKLIKERDELNLQFLERTTRWIESYDPSVSSKYLQDKIDISTKIAANAVSLDPYIRKKGPFDRAGFLKISLY